MCWIKVMKTGLVFVLENHVIAKCSCHLSKQHQNFKQKPHVQLYVVTTKAPQSNKHLNKNNKYFVELKRKDFIPKTKPCSTLINQ